MNAKIIFIFIAGLIVGSGTFYLVQNPNNLSLENAEKIAIDFINNAIQAENANVTASLLDITEESGVYKLHLKIEDKEYDSFLSKDGRYLFSTAFDLQQMNQQETKEYDAVSLENFAKCLSDSGAKFYGAFWCAHCKNQKEMFGSAVEFLPYVECSTPDGNGQLDICKNNNVTSYPTWEFTGGARETGEVSLDKLAEQSGCKLLK